MRIERQLICVALLLLPVPGNAAEVEEAEAKLRLGYSNGTSRNTAIESSATLLPRLGVSFTDRLWFETSARVRLHGADKLEPDRPVYDYYTSASRPRMLGDSNTAELRDFYFELNAGASRLRLGKQQIVWGNLDGLRVLDQMNPHSFREFILADFEESRIGLWSLYFDTSVGPWRAELVWTPDTTAHDIPEPGAWFEFQAPRYRYGASPGSPLPEITTDLPKSMIDDATYGARLSRAVGRLDIRLQAQTGLDYEPLGRLETTSRNTVLEQFYRKRQIYGLGFDSALAGLVVRGEFSAQPNRTFNINEAGDLRIAEADQWTGAIGLDLNGPWNTFINIQYVYDRISSPPDGLVRPNSDHIATVFARRTFAYDAIIAELRWYGSLDDNDGLARGSVSWAFSDNFSIELGADFFYGDEDGIFGQFQDADRVSASATFTF